MKKGTKPKLLGKDSSFQWRLVNYYFQTRWSTKNPYSDLATLHLAKLIFVISFIYVTAVDHVKEAKAIRMEFLWTVLIGTIIAFALDIAVHLIIKWRKL